MIRLHLSALRLCHARQDYAALASLPAMQRRRLSPLAKLALNCALQSLQQQKVDYIVWASQYGEEEKTLSILEDVLTGQTPSPTQFSTSVHNAVAGLYSILYQDATVSTSLSGTWADAMIEAYSILKTQLEVSHVLVVYYEAPLPAVYRADHEFEAFALSAVVSLDPANVELVGLQQTQAMDTNAFYQFWQDDACRTWSGWKKC